VSWKVRLLDCFRGSSLHMNNFMWFPFLSQRLWKLRMSIASFHSLQTRRILNSSGTGKKERTSSMMSNKSVGIISHLCFMALRPGISKSKRKMSGHLLYVRQQK
jgi:hypothetical protein